MYAMFYAPKLLELTIIQIITCAITISDQRETYTLRRTMYIYKNLKQPGCGSADEC